MSGPVVVRSRADMHAFGEELAAVLRAGDLVVLAGPLGAGKTTLTQGIGHGLRVAGDVTSPTFVIARVHRPLDAAAGGPALVHADAYRLGSALELEDLDLDASVEESVTVVEWGEGLAEALAEDRLVVRIERPDVEPGAAADPADDVDEHRLVVLEGIGPRWAGVRLPRAD